MFSGTAFSPRNGSSRKGFHPCVEALEDRTCPTMLRVCSGALSLDGSHGLTQVRMMEHQACKRLPTIGVAAKHLRTIKHRRHHHRPGHGHAKPMPASAMGRILVNGVPLSTAAFQTLQHLGLHPLAGSYWYDPRSGAAGMIGQGTSGFLPAGLTLGGPLQADASNGTSGVFVNGRQLTMGEKTFLESVLGSPIAPGSYFVDANGDAGMEGGPVLVNLIQLARQRGVGRTGALSTYDVTGISVLGDGSFVGILNQDGSSVTFA